MLTDRGELREHFDIWRIETEAGRRIEEGLALFLARYGADDDAVLPVVRALGSFDDVADDPFLPVGGDQVESWFRARQPEVAVHLDRTASSDAVAAGERAALHEAVAVRPPVGVGGADRCR